MNIKKLKRREEKEENNKKKRSKSYTNKGKPKKIGRMVAPIHNFDPKILPEGSAKLRWAGRGAGDLIFHSLCGPVDRKKPLTWAAQVRQI
jgi:hypothetical protein